MSQSSYAVPIQNRFAFLDIDSDDELPRRKQNSSSVVAPLSSNFATNNADRSSAAAARVTTRLNNNNAATATTSAANNRRAAADESYQGRLPPYQGMNASDNAVLMSRPGAAPRRFQDKQKFKAAENLARGGPRAAFKTSTERNFGSRQFDRHSGTGRGNEMKKGGGGGRNWGNEAVDFGATGGPASSSLGVAALSSAGPTSSSAAPAMSSSPTHSDDNTAADLTSGAFSSNEEELQRPTSDDRQEPPREILIDFADYQKEQKIKAALLADQQAAVLSASVRAVDSKQLELEGYERYEREETPAEKAAREIRDANNSDDDDNDAVDDDRNRRSKNYHNVMGGSDFSVPLVTISRGRRVVPGGATRSSAREKPRAVETVNLDLADQSAFPCLG